MAHSAPVLSATANPPHWFKGAGWIGNHRTLWVPLCVTRGWGPRSAPGESRLLPGRLILYLCLLDLCRGGTRHVTVGRDILSARTGLSRKVVGGALRDLGDVGLIGLIQYGSGSQYVISVVTGTLQDHVSVPVAALWRREGMLEPPTPLAARSRTVDTLLALLRRVDFKTGILSGATLQDIADGVGVSRAHVNNGLRDMVGTRVPGTPRHTARTCGWLTVIPKRRPVATGRPGDYTFRQMPSMIRFDWRKLDPQEGSVTPSFDEETEAFMV